MKKYIQPAMAMFTVNVQSVLTETSLPLDGDVEVNGNQALGKRRRNNNAWEDDDMWEEEGDQVTF